MDEEESYHCVGSFEVVYSAMYLFIVIPSTTIYGGCAVLTLLNGVEEDEGIILPPLFSNIHTSSVDSVPVCVEGIGEHTLRGGHGWSSVGGVSTAPW